MPLREKSLFLVCWVLHHIMLVLKIKHLKLNTQLRCVQNLISTMQAATFGILGKRSPR